MGLAGSIVVSPDHLIRASPPQQDAPLEIHSVRLVNRHLNTTENFGEAPCKTGHDSPMLLNNRPPLHAFVHRASPFPT